MADIDVTSGAVTGHPGRRGRRTPYLARIEVTAAAAVAAKGSALASADVVQAMDIPANTLVLAAGGEVTTADSGTTVPADISFDAVDFVAAGDLTTAAVLTSIDLIAGPSATANTLDVKLDTLVAAGDDWVVDIWAVLLDVSAYPTVQDAKQS
jgi:hypothetical protein